jgi:hypothetical protein
MNIGDKAVTLHTDKSYWFDKEQKIKVTSDQGTYASVAEAEKAAKKVAESGSEDATIVKEGDQYHVYGIEEVKDKFSGAAGSNHLEGAASGTMELFMTDAQEGDVRAAGTRDKTAQIDKVTEAFKRAGFSEKDAYTITKRGISSANIDDITARLNEKINDPNLMHGTSINQARRLLDMLNEYLTPLTTGQT